MINETIKWYVGFEDDKISYYDLLGLIKNNQAPERIRVKICSYTRDYKIEYDDEDFNYYTIVDEHKTDENYRSYLHECYLESDMFEKTIEILKPVEDKKQIKKLSYKYVNTYGRVSQHRKSEESLIDKINELIDEVNKKNKN